jgi:molybdopterin synthase sulfur carrier subunit
LASLAKVTVKFFATVREAVGIRSAEMEAQDIRELIDKLRHQFGRRFVNAVIDSESGELKRFYSCMVNGKRIELLNGYDTELMDGDAVALFPPIGGG